MASRQYLPGMTAIVFGVGFNIPYAILATTFDYPGILRQDPGFVLDRFAEGGSGLILTWYGFALAALVMIPVATALSLNSNRMRSLPGWAIGAAIAGTLAGLSQAIGLVRWVFVIPQIAREHADPKTSETARLIGESTFSMLNAYGGVAIGEHIGQLLTALFVVMVARIQLRERKPVSACLGWVSGATITIGTGEGLAISLGNRGDLFSLFTIAGFLALTAWFVATGIGLLRARPDPAAQV